MNTIKKILIMCSIALTILLYGCGGNGALNGLGVNYNLSASELAKNFYTSYIKKYEANASEEEMLKIKEAYMTETMIEELDLRSLEMEADAILGVQDGTGFLDKMEIEPGDDDESAVARFVVPVEGDEIAKNTYVFHIHFRNVDNKKLIDTYDFLWIETDSDGDDSRIEYKTQYANKETLTEEDLTKMSNQRKYYDELFEDGYIG